MINLRIALALMLFYGVAGTWQAAAQKADSSSEPTIEITGRTEGDYFVTNGVIIITNGVQVTYSDSNGPVVLTAERGSVNRITGDIYAENGVRVQRTNETSTGDKFHYNYETRQVDWGPFRTGMPPFFVMGDSLHSTGGKTNAVLTGTNGLMTTDDYYQPLQKIRASHFLVVPGKYVIAYDATLYVGSTPVFYFPRYKYRLDQQDREFTLLPGYRSLFGPFLLTTYNWVLDDQIRGGIHADYREKRGFGVGPDVNYDFGDMGRGTFKYYYARDHTPGTDPDTGAPVPRDRERAYFSYNATPLTNLNILAQVAQQSDPLIVRDFFESQYNKDIQPATFVEANQQWRNWSVDAFVQPRVNGYWETVERLPDVRLTGFRQQIGNTPFYYESQSSMGYYRRLFSDTNTASPGDFSGSRADSFHQITMPETFFGWLNFTPRVGGRFTYYGDASGPGATTTNEYRGVFNTGAELSFTASRVWPGVKNSFWDMDGLRHIIQPSIDYVYIPQPNVLPNQLPQFDYEPANSLRLLPIEFPDYNSIDSINSQNTIRYGVDNRLQTKRNGEVQDFLKWGLYMDWHLRPRTDQTTFSDIFSDFSLKPRSWITFNSSTRYSIAQGQFNLAEHSITLEPNSTVNWTVGHLYLRSGPLFGEGDNLYSSILFFRLNENWGTRVAHYFDASSGTLQEQDYTIYRDMRSWSAGLTFRALNSLSGKDYGVAFTFSFKSFPRYALGTDTVRAAPLIGY